MEKNTQKLSEENCVTETTNSIQTLSSGKIYPFVYDFKYFLDFAPIVNITKDSYIRFTFTTATWSGSTGFYVECYKTNYNDSNFITKTFIKSTYPNPSTALFALSKNNTQYRFRFTNMTEGEQIIGSGFSEVFTDYE